MTMKPILYVIHADTQEIIRVMSSKKRVLEFINRDLYKGLGWEITTVENEHPIDTVSAKSFLLEG